MRRPKSHQSLAAWVAAGVSLLAGCGADRPRDDPAKAVNSVMEEYVTAKLLQLPETEREKLRTSSEEGIFLHIYFSPSYLLCNLRDGSEPARTLARHGVRSLDGRLWAVALGLQRRLKGEAPEVLEDLRRTAEIERTVPVAR